jgi:microcystin-dependent protein
MAATVDDLALQVATLTSQIANLLSAVNVQKSYIDMASQIAVSGITGSSGSAAPAPGKSPIGAPNGLFSYAWLDPASNVVLAANCAGTANAITATFAPAVIALVNGLTVEVRAASANTTATPTFQANASAAKTIVKGSGVALVAGDISGAGHWLTLTYDSTLDKWVLGNPAMGLGVAAKGANADITSLSALTTPITGLQGGIPAGSVIHVAMSVAPSGYLKANGALISRTTYAALFAAIGVAFGAGDGTTTFALPDLRGEFMRGWDDARGVDSGRALGSTQTQDIQPHNHAHNVGVSAGSPGSGSQTNLNSGAIWWVNVNSQTSNAGGTETRPRNIALLACIKF